MKKEKRQNATLHIYCMVYTDENVDVESTLKNQEQLGINNAKKLGFKDYKIWNEGQTSDSLGPFARPVLKKLVELIESGSIKHLFISDWLRLSDDNFHLETFRDIFNRYDMKIWMDTPKPIDISNPCDKSLLGFIVIYRKIGNKREIILTDMLCGSDHDPSPRFLCRTLTCVTIERFFEKDVCYAIITKMQLNICNLINDAINYTCGKVGIQKREFRKLLNEDNLLDVTVVI